MARLTEFLLLASIPALIILHQHLSPYTKVEESFNIQAVHDILKFGVPLGQNASDAFHAEYDHFTFPGAVPRSFVGAVMLAGVAKPFIWLFTTIDRQSLVRDILGAFNAVALIRYATAVRRAFGKDTAVWYIFFQASQFHVIYYASRTLPNMFAFGITTLAFGNLLPDASASVQPARTTKKHRLALYLFTISGIIFRAEIAVLLGATVISLLLQGRISIRQEIISAAIPGVVVGVLTTVCMDSFFWQRFPLWPELSGFLYNIISGKASDWGTQPWHFYFTNALPRLLLNPLVYIVALPLSFFPPFRHQAIMSQIIPSLAYISLYSLQPHKEWRFIIYAIPPFTTAAARSASYVWTHRTKTVLYRLLSIFFILSTLATFFISNFVLLPVSMANYPGANALNALHKRAHNSQRVIPVHMDTFACQTGVTRFLEKPPPKSMLIVMPGSPDGRYPELRTGSSKWLYDKTENEKTKRSDEFWDQFKYALVENPEQLRGTGRWELVQDVVGFDGVRILRPGDAGEGSQVEKDFIKRFLGKTGVEKWEKFQESQDLARRYVTAGWWAEVRMVPKLKIMEHLWR